jgi:hypothetical protein
MYRLSPYRYLIEGLLGQGKHYHQEIVETLVCLVRVDHVVTL